MVGKNPSLQGYNNRKRSFTSLSKKKQNDAQKEMEEDLLMMQEVDREACWKVYRLEEEHCQAHTIPNPKVKNCKQNPYCIHRLGLEKFEKLQQSPQSPEALVRRNLAEQPCGLANFGNYCYVNSFLQIWFNDIQFRQCIYDWVPSPYWEKPEQAKLDIQAVLNCLQRLFITMQFTPFDSTNANEFIQLLSLNNEQQDVQEFHTLLFDTIMRNLEGHPNGGPMLEVIRRLFQSRITQTISCGQCRRENRTDSEYRSLQIGIDGFDSLVSALRAFFEKESVPDYRCDNCGVTGWVSRTSNFAQLPEVLIIQLNRFVFDNNGRQRKLKSPIHYPRFLPISELQPGVGGDDYELCAVMIHEGNNTNSGHYYDLIREPISTQWYKYNDKEVVAEKRPPGYVGKKPEAVPARAAADTKGCYGLIYQRMGTDQEEPLQFPPRIKHEVINTLEEDFSRQSREGSRSANLWTELIKSHGKKLHNFWKDLEVHDGLTLVDNPEQIVFLPTSYLSDILTKEFKAIEEFKGTNSEYDYIVEPINDFEIKLCKHGCVPLESVHKGELKAVNAEAADRLLKEYVVKYRVKQSTQYQEENKEAWKNQLNKLNGTNNEFNNTFLTDDSDQTKEEYNRIRTGADICVDCVEEVRRCTLFKHTLHETEERFSSLLRKDALQDRAVEPTSSYSLLRSKPVPPNGAVLVSLNHLRNFKKLALRQMEANGQMINTEDEPVDKRSKDDQSEDGEAERKSAEIVCLEDTPQNLDLPCTSSSLTQPQNLPGKLSGVGHQQNNVPMKRIEEQQEEEKERKEDDEKENIQEGEVGQSQKESIVQNGERIPRFNEELFCKHNKLAPNVKRVWLTREEWGVLSNNFFNCCNPISCNAEECGECIEETQAMTEVKESNKKQLENLLADIQPLIKKWRDRKCWESHEIGVFYDHVLCQKFVEELRNAQTKIRSKNVPEIPRICQECLLCDLHKLPYLALENAAASPGQPAGVIGARWSQRTSPGIPISGTEWNELVALYKRHVPEHPRPLPIVLEENGQYSAFCDFCHFKHNEEEAERRFTYPDGADVYVKQKGDESEEELQAKTATTVTRRNTKERGLMKFWMTSYMTVRDLKVKLYERIKQSPNDQLLYREDTALEDELTLEMARVPSNNSGCPLILIVQQRGEDGSDLIAGGSGGGAAPRPSEKNFRDTALS